MHWIMSSNPEIVVFVVLITPSFDEVIDCTLPIHHLQNIAVRQIPHTWARK